MNFQLNWEKEEQGSWKENGKENHSWKRKEIEKSVVYKYNITPTFLLIIVRKHRVSSEGLPSSFLAISTIILLWSGSPWPCRAYPPYISMMSEIVTISFYIFLNLYFDSFTSSVSFTTSLDLRCYSTSFTLIIIYEDKYVNLIV